MMQVKLQKKSKRGNYTTAGIRSTSSHPRLKDFIPEKDATVVAHLLKSGAIILGKTNLPQLGLDLQINRPIFGITNNPWNTDDTPGGSSGGSAAADPSIPLLGAGKLVIYLLIRTPGAGWTIARLKDDSPYPTFLGPVKKIQHTDKPVSITFSAAPTQIY